MQSSETVSKYCNPFDVSGNSPAKFTTRTLAAGEHLVVMEYYEEVGSAVAQLQWQPDSCPVGQYRAEYFNNPSLTDAPVLVRCEAAPLSYDWGTDSPATGVNANNFSVRWTGRFNFTAGSYNFIARANDGVRVYLDGTAIIDAWIYQSTTTYQATRTLAAGEHLIVMEYYDSTGNAVAQFQW